MAKTNNFVKSKTAFLMLLIQILKQKLIKNVSVVQSYKPGKEANQELSSLIDHGE